MNINTTLIRLRTWPREYDNTNRRINDVYQPFNRIEPRRTLSDHTIVGPVWNNELLHFNLQPIRVNPLIQLINRNNNLIDEMAVGIDNLNIEIMRLFNPDWKFYLCASICTVSIIWFSKEKIHSIIKECINWFVVSKSEINVDVNNLIDSNTESNKNVVMNNSESDNGKFIIEFGKKLIKIDTYFSPNWLPFLLPIIIFKRK